MNKNIFNRMIGRATVFAAALAVTLCLTSTPQASAQVPDKDNQQVTPQQPDSAQPGMQQPSQPSVARPDMDRPVPESAQSDADRNQNKDKDRANSDRGDQRAAQGQITGKRLEKFDAFLDSHPQIAADLQKNPSLVNDSQYVNSHKELKDFLEDHPAVRNALKDHPEQFINRENRREQNENPQPR